MKTRILSLLTAAVVVVAAMVGQSFVLAPTASALTHDETVFITLLADEGIGPTANGSYADLVFIGHAIAYDVRNGVHPADEAYTLWLNSPYLTKDAAIKVVASAIVVFAPEMVPIYTDEGPPGDMVA